jgi:hypothetical protein
MRVWLREDERRPDPEPAVTDDRTAVLVGLACWVVAAVVLLALAGPLFDAGRGGWLWTCLVGIGVGLVGLAYLQRIRRHG